MDRKNKTMVKQFTQDPHNMNLYQQEGFLLEGTELIHKIMKEKGITIIDIAKAMKASPRNIERYLEGYGMTMRHFAGIMCVLGYTVHLKTESLNIHSKEPEISID